MKTEIEHVQHLLEKAKVQLQKDFDVWWKQQANQVRIGSLHHMSWPLLFYLFVSYCLNFLYSKLGRFFIMFLM